MMITAAYLDRVACQIARADCDIADSDELWRMVLMLLRFFRNDDGRRFLRKTEAADATRRHWLDV